MVMKVIYTYSIIFGGLFLGYIFQRRGIFSDPIASSDRLMKSLIKYVTPAIICIAFWNADFENINILTLPILGATLSTILLVVSAPIAALLKLPSGQKGSFITSSMFSNIGYTLGGFLCFALLGEAGFTLSVIYCLYFGLYFYTIGFYVAEYYSSEKRKSIKEIFKSTFTGSMRLFPLVGIASGLLLNRFGPARPYALGLLNGPFMAIATFLYLFGIGLTIRFSAIKEFKIPCAWMSIIKFIISPAIALTLAYIMGYKSLMGGLPFKVMVIESMMPVAILSMILPALFNLDRDLSNSCWIVTTLLMIPILPIILIILNLC